MNENQETPPPRELEADVTALEDLLTLAKAAKSPEVATNALDQSLND